MNGKGNKGEGDRISTAGQYLRQRPTTERKSYNRFLELLEASAVSPKAFGGFENESSRTMLNLLKFVNQLLRNPRDVTRVLVASTVWTV